ncbi:MAG: hypothetical protein ABL998_14735, partial [Planctomycetota bacterium]
MDSAVHRHEHEFDRRGIALRGDGHGLAGGEERLTGAVVRVMLLDIDAPDVPDYIIALEEHAVSVFP